MTDEEAINALQEGWNLLFVHAAIIAELPLEDWLAAFERAETVAPILDPTLYRDYIYGRKGDVTKSVINAALPLKRAVAAARDDVLSGRVKS